jgi:transglutaminase-like putative cysteine protease
MRKSLWCGGVVVLCLVAPLRAAPPAPRLVQETWDAAYIEGAKCGYIHSTVYETSRDGQTILRVTKSMHLQIKRYKNVVALRMDVANDETPEGKVVGVSLTQYTDTGKFVLTGAIDGDNVILRSSKDQTETKAPWDDKVLGMARQESLFADKKVKPGDKLEFLSFEPALPATLKVKALVKAAEEVDLLVPVEDGTTTRVERAKKSLVRVEVASDKVMVGGKAIQLPRLVVWLDKEFQQVRSQLELPGLGQLALYRTTRQAAEKEGVAPALLPDLGLNTLITLDRTVPHIHEAKSVIYRITVKDEDDAATTFAKDARQEIKKLKDDCFELTVRAIRSPTPVENPGEAKKEYVGSSYFLDADDDKVKALARDAVGKETDPWRKAQKIEKWVHENMQPSSAIGFACASQIANDKKGDCRQHAMLTAAMCRAAGVPSRTALGLVYVPDDKGAVLGFHMWTEVWVKGQWLGIDATLGQGSVGPGHLKISDHSWADTLTLVPLLPVTRVMGKLKVEVVRVEELK